jgi:heat shock protein HslJ
VPRFHIATALFTGAALCAFAAGADDLTGTSWQLVEIKSMDYSVDVPEDASAYTLEFMADGSAALQADCNRGAGSWISEAAGELRFSPIASTGAMCPPGSLSEKYLAQFEWVRSYVMQDAHLFLATMADGSIIEFEPAAGAGAAATVLGEELRTSDAGELQDAILTGLFDQYAAEQGIKAETEEIGALLDAMRRGRAEDGSSAEEELTPDEAAEVEAMETTMATDFIRRWKINKALHEQYGGRIIYQQLGPEPLDAYRAFVEQRQAEGAFAVNDPALADAFWSYFTNESIHDFMEPGGADAKNAFSAPPWEQRP